MSFAPRTLRAGVELPGWRPVGERLLGDGAGNLAWVIDAPRRRNWSPTGVLQLGEAAEWALEETDAGAVLRCGDPVAEADIVELHGDVARAFESDRSEPMTVVPSFRPFTGPIDLADYLVGGRVVTGGPRGRWQVEQAALSLYRIARLRGGAFWDAVATHIAGATASRVEEAPGGRPVTDYWGKREVHARFVIDAALLLAAHAEVSGDARFARATARAADAIESFGVPLAGGRWYLHDSVEQSAGRNDLVLNTHVHAITALRACGREVDPGLRALDAALGRRARGARALASGAALAAADLARAFAPRGATRKAALAAHRRLAPLVAAQRALRIPGGYLARDASGAVAPSTYLAVNLCDLASLQRNTPTPVAAAALAEGLRYARRFRYMRAELGDDQAAAQVMLPAGLRNAGAESAALRAVERARQAGLAPLVGWPGRVDALWSHLARGTP